MKIRITLLAAMAIGLPGSALATSFDFTDLGGENTQLAHCETVNGITACAWDNIVTDINDVPVDADESLLYLRNVTNDHGLGVCDSSNPDQECGRGGNYNELDNRDSNEGITLENGTGEAWSSLWVSSLDVGGTDGSEEGWLFYGDWTSPFAFGYDEVTCNVECDILALAQAALSAADYLELIWSPVLLFTSNWDAGTDNDYLVWKGSTATVPEPGTLALLGLGLMGIGAARRRKVA